MDECSRSSWPSRTLRTSLRKSSRQPLDSPQHPGESNEDHRADEGHDDRAENPARRPDAKRAEDPAANDATEQPENAVHQHAVAATPHDLSGKPAGDDSDEHRIDHVVLLALCVPAPRGPVCSVLPLKSNTVVLPEMITSANPHARRCSRIPGLA